MLIQFTFRNFRSFPNETTLSMVAEKLKSQDKTLDENNVFAVGDKLSLLTSAAIYGPNASGKSNVIKALEFMGTRVTTFEARERASPAMRAAPFRLDADRVSEQSLFEVAFVDDGIRYRYGFELSAEEVLAEWLYYHPGKAERLVFRRNGHELKLGKDFQKLLAPISNLRFNPNILFGTVALLFIEEFHLLDWFWRLTTVSDLLDPQPDAYTRNMVLAGHRADEVKQLVRKLDMGINDFSVTLKEVRLGDSETSPKGSPEQPFDAIPNFDGEDILVETSHTRYDLEGNVVGEERFNLDDDESDGTKKLFALAGLLVDTLTSGGVLVVDELDARLHTTLTREIVGLFNDHRSNPKHAQLIFATHDTNLLDNSLFRRDQVWFVEKDTRGASQLYSLAEFRGVRNDKDYEIGYMQGRYGAQPFIHALKETVAGYGNKKEE